MKSYKITLIHKSNCSTSRKALKLLKEAGIEPVIREYMKLPLSDKELTKLLKKLKLKPEDIVRKKEKIYKEEFAAKTYTDEEWISILAANPVLIERPIIIKNRKAAIARPPEIVLEWV